MVELTERTPTTVQPLRQRRAWRRWLVSPAAVWALGLAVRLLLMPISFHSDLYQIYSRSAMMLEQGGWFSWSGQVMVQLLHTLWLAAIRWLLPGSDGIWSPYSGVAGIGAQPQDLSRFLAYPDLPRALFLLKLPYLAADATIALLLQQLAAPRWRTRVLALWWLNPITIYTSAVFGRHDAIAIALVVLGLVLAQRGRPLLGLIPVVLGGLVRFFPLFILPYYILAFRRSWREVLGLLILAGCVWLGLDTLVLMRTGASPTLTLLNDYPHVRYLLAIAVVDANGDPLPIFPVVYLALLLSWIRRDGRGIRAAVGGSAATLLLLIALTPFNPQYVIWTVPLLSLIIATDLRRLLAHAAQVGLFLLWLARWGSSATWSLFAPLGPALVQQLPDPQLLAAALLPTTVWQPTVRALFVGASLWLAWEAYHWAVACDAARSVSVEEEGWQ